jgi:hypothetical protein
MTPCWPDYSPSTLALFLRARRMAREELHRRRKPLADELVAVTGLPLSDVDSAFDGRLKDAGKRASLWAVLGHHPSDFGIVFDNRGGQRIG